MHAQQSGAEIPRFPLPYETVRIALVAVWKLNVLRRIDLRRVYGRGKHGTTTPHPPPNRRRNHVNSVPDFFKNPMRLAFFAVSPACRPLPEPLACVLKPHLSPG
jgi:hypothetical protein